VSPTRKLGNESFSGDCKEALKAYPAVTQGIQFAQIAALGSHLYILENGPELPRVPGPHAEDGGGVLEGM
jgi:hypothetical protein